MPFTQEADATGDDWPRYFNKTLVTMIRPEMLQTKVPLLRSDVSATFDRLAAQSASASAPEWCVTDAFDTIYHLLFQLLSRIVGATEVSEDIHLARKMLSVFEKFESSNSTTGIIFPWLRVFTPSYILRMVLGTVLYINFNRIINERKRTGRREDDALQYLLDQDTKLDVIIKFQISAVWAALLTTGANGTWLLVLLASNPTWQARCRTELNHALSKHRTRPAQSATDVLDSLTLEDWESSFPVLDACLRETMRVAMPGAVFRQNTSGGDIPLGTTGEVVPDGSFATFLVDDVHMDPEYYPDPERFDPGRFLERGRGKKGLEITLIVAYFMARFDFELSDKQGNPSKEMPQLPGRNEHTAKKSKVPVYLRYKPRV
ncbi:hypothetical protein NEMBOFW57_008584 [Staphylotrichum longicolle]|uniref:Cytochrome P450 n=1 Tax=Staphylotrichum longicolle TaxID=669026 RepID=A0AAD4HWS0_9PEZI|nr:hypothetical protein NEMBOFW57_008584 [Staphylotrichum longicolle]